MLELLDHFGRNRAEEVKGTGDDAVAGMANLEAVHTWLSAGGDELLAGEAGGGCLSAVSLGTYLQTLVIRAPGTALWCRRLRATRGATQRQADQTDQSAGGHLVSEPETDLSHLQ